MRVRLAERIGFCFGVKRAIHMAEEALRLHRKVYSLGSIIHNAQVVQRLSGKGLEIIRDPGRAKGGAVLISSHGAPPAVFAKIKKRGLGLIDTTCPFVLHAQRLAMEMAREGYMVVIVGEKTHPEVKALVGFARGRAIVVKGRDDPALRRVTGDKVAVISQTTQAIANFRGVANTLLRKRPREIRIFNTICNDTGKRQEAAADLAKTVDAMVIIGGRQSANTKRLFEVCKGLNDAYLVETDRDVRSRWFEGKRTVGIASGASTPEWVITKVVNKIKKLSAGIGRKG
jgi:4-hydroxy-3-methylbut-2-enyl diphosphate reductase